MFKNSNILIRVMSIKMLWAIFISAFTVAAIKFAQASFALYVDAQGGLTFIEVAIIALQELPSAMFSMLQEIILISSALFLSVIATSRGIEKVEVMGQQMQPLILRIAGIFFVGSLIVLPALQTPIADLYYKAYIKQKEYPRSIKVSLSSDGIWIRRFSGDRINIVNAQTFDRATQQAKNLNLYHFSRTKGLIQAWSAKRGTLERGLWVMQDGLEISPSRQAKFFKNKALPTNLSISDILGNIPPPNVFSIWDIKTFEELLEKNGLPSYQHKTFFAYSISLPLLVVINILFPAIFFLYFRHRVSIPVNILITLVCTFCVNLPIRLSQSMARSGLIDPYLGLLILNLIITFVGIYIISKQK